MAAHRREAVEEEMKNAMAIDESTLTKGPNGEAVLLRVAVAV